jgi:RNA polymerase sigma-70 factor (ECF subfamily)
VTEDEDSAAIRRCQQGDIEALGVLIGRYQENAFRLAFLLSGSQMIAEDIVQESFLAAYRAMPRFDLARPFAPWLYRIVTNTARMYHRARERRPAISLDEVAEHDEQAKLYLDTAVSPEEHAERQEVRQAVGAMLAALTTAQREAIVLRYYYGFSDQEIAEIVGCRVPAARQRLYGGLHALERLIRQRSPWLVDETTARHTEATDAI